MAFYQDFTSPRTTEPDFTSLLNQLRTIEPTIGIQHELNTNFYRLKKNTSWTPSEVTSAQIAIDSAPNTTPELTAQSKVDRFDIVTKAIVLTIIDEINILRAAAGLTPRTPAQAIQAIRNKAGSL